MLGEAGLPLNEMRQLVLWQCPACAAESAGRGRRCTIANTVR